MKKTLQLHAVRKTLTLVRGIAFERVIGWANVSMRDLKMDIILPMHKEGHAPCPTILWLCGGAYKEVDRSAWLPQLVNLAQRGYVIASAEYRTSNQFAFPAALEDVKSAVRFLKANARDLCVDSERICVMGESAGGTLASLAGVTGARSEFDRGSNLEYGSGVNAVVDFYGLIDANLQVGTPGKAVSTIPAWCLEAFFGPENCEAARANPANYVSPDTPAFLIFHGNNDPVVPIANSELLYQKLTENHCDATFYVFDGAVHADDVFYQDAVMDIIDAFLKRVM